MNGCDVSDEFLRFHGDVDAANAHLDFAVNVRGTEPPPWLLEALTEELSTIASYPQHGRSSRHGRPWPIFMASRPRTCCCWRGAAEGFSLLPRLVPAGGSALVVHPSFTEPEYALRAAGVPVVRLLLNAPLPSQPASPTAVYMAVVGKSHEPHRLCFMIRRAARLGCSASGGG